MRRARLGSRLRGPSLQTAPKKQEEATQITQERCAHALPGDLGRARQRLKECLEQSLNEVPLISARYPACR